LGNFFYEKKYELSWSKWLPGPSFSKGDNSTFKEWFNTVADQALNNWGLVVTLIEHSQSDV